MVASQKGSNRRPQVKDNVYFCRHVAGYFLLCLLPMTYSPPTPASPVADWVRHVKRSLHGLMNGVLSASMRDKGAPYKVNFGVELPRLRSLADELPHTAVLAEALRQEPIRECRLLAAMLMPPAEMTEAMAEDWVADMKATEEAELTSMHLFCHLPAASSLAFCWMARTEECFRLCGFLIMGRLFMAGATPSDRDAAEYLDQTAATLRDPAPRLRRAAYNALLKYADTGSAQAAAADALLEAL